MEPLSTLKLIILKGPREGETFEFKPGSTVRIGRVVKGNNLPIKDSGISSKHLIIAFESIKWVIRDLDSSNGTLLNDYSLSPNVPVDLSDGDSIKVGEFTSISVQISCNIESNLRRNPRRGVVEESGPVGGIRGRRGRVVKESEVKKVLEEEDGGKLENSPVVVEVVEQRMRGRARRPRGLKDEVVEELCELPKTQRELGNVCPVEVKEQPRIRRTRRNRKEQDTISGVKSLLNEQLDNGAAAAAVSVVENQGRGLQGKPRAMKSEMVDEIYEIQEPQLNAGVDRVVELQQGSQVMTRRNRSKKNEETIISDLVFTRIEQASSLHIIEEEIDGRNTRGGKRRRNLQIKASACAPIGIPEDKENAEDANLGETAQIDVREDMENADVLTSGEESHKERVSACGVKESSKVEMGSTSGIRQSSSKTLEVPDLEKMTLGEWFDYLEFHLRKQIIDETEEMIENMRRKAKAVHEYKVQQINEKRTQCL